MSEMQVAHDFAAESELLFEALAGLDEAAYGAPTLFKAWDVNRVLRHLHFWNYAADVALFEPEKFDSLYAKLQADSKKTGNPSESADAMERAFAGDSAGDKLRVLWRGYYRPMALRFAESDPKKRVRWAGPDMSVRSSITARLMETWSHAQAIYDALGVERQFQDHIKNICVLGVNTFGWSFMVHGHEVPAEKPYLALTAPSGEVWEWGEKSAASSIKGKAHEFCQVVTQCRNIADVSLEVQGETAQQWMAEAQCFAGGPETPPAAGARRRQK